MVLIDSSHDWYIENSLNGTSSTIVNKPKPKPRTNPKPKPKPKPKRKNKNSYRYQSFISVIKKHFSVFKYQNYRKPDYMNYGKWKNPFLKGIPISYSSLPINHTVVIITASGDVWLYYCIHL